MKDPLELQVRRRIYEEVVMNPGLHYRELQRRLGLPSGQLDYHLRFLKKQEVITSRREGGYIRYYPVQGLKESEKRALAFLRQEIPRAIIIHILMNPGSTHGDILSGVRISGATLSYHLKRMVSRGIVKEEVRGREKHYTIADPDEIAALLVTYRRSFLDSLVDSFVRTLTGGGAP
ncbi:transcriptional regulator [Thermoplasmatales archaeon ex4484_36]|nr:MAG: transcriptional regulator [Thermoplasmatales archaeon ex4484_36]HDD60357.1 winged helix-turn-helix transcriptional regulator [Euryarchaeota archaeon]